MKAFFLCMHRKYLEQLA